jgi:thioesterase domain-containing protein
MAARHIASLRTVQPTGPYLVGGFCAGGLVAYEIAQQLRAAGERVDLLVVVDTAALNARLRPLAPIIGAVERLTPPARRLDRRAAMFRAARYYAWRLDDVRRRSLGEQVRWAGRLLTRRFRRLTEAPVAPGDGAGNGNDPHVGLDERLIANGPAGGPGQSVLMFQQRAAVAYVQRPYDGPMHAIWASEVLGHRQRQIDPTRGWRRLASPVNVDIVESSHVGLITRNLPAFAERLRAVLASVDPG